MTEKKESCCANDVCSCCPCCICICTKQLAKTLTPDAKKLLSEALQSTH